MLERLTFLHAASASALLGGVITNWVGEEGKI